MFHRRRERACTNRSIGSHTFAFTSDQKVHIADATGIAWTPVDLPVPAVNLYGSFAGAALVGTSEYIEPEFDPIEIVEGDYLSSTNCRPET